MKTVLFVCVENSCRSQMAEGFARELGINIIEVFSVGSSPSGIINPIAIEVMQEIGIDIKSHKSKSFKEIPVKKFDYVITLGCNDICPYVPSNKHIEWQISDPKGKDINYFRNVRDTIKSEVESFIRNIKETNNNQNRLY